MKRKLQQLFNVQTLLKISKIRFVFLKQLFQILILGTKILNFYGFSLKLTQVILVIGCHYRMFGLEDCGYGGSPPTTSKNNFSFDPTMSSSHSHLQNLDNMERPLALSFYKINFLRSMCTICMCSKHINIIIKVFERKYVEPFAGSVIYFTTAN